MTSFRFGVYVANYSKFEEPIASEDLKDPFLRSVMFFYEVISLRCLCS
jgi:hypothetical protein